VHLRRPSAVALVRKGDRGLPGTLRVVNRPQKAAGNCGRFRSLHQQGDLRGQIRIGFKIKAGFIS